MHDPIPNVNVANIYKANTAHFKKEWNSPSNDIEASQKKFDDYVNGLQDGAQTPELNLPETSVPVEDATVVIKGATKVGSLAVEASQPKELIKQ